MTTSSKTPHEKTMEQIAKDTNHALWTIAGQLKDLNNTLKNANVVFNTLNNTMAAEDGPPTTPGDDADGRT